jgi:hypothetical protein
VFVLLREKPKVIGVPFSEKSGWSAPAPSVLTKSSAVSPVRLTVSQLRLVKACCYAETY